MSYYDDASIMFIGGAATGTDGKAGTAKPIDGGSPLYVARGSNLTATRVDSNGLIAKGRENLLLQSNQFDTTWTTDGASVTSGQSGYDGSSDAWKLLGTGGSFPRVQQNKSISGVSTFSVYAKAGNVNVLRLLTISGSNTDTKFQLTESGSILTQTGSERIESKITRLGSTDWYRCSITFNGSPTNFRIYPMSDSSTFAVNGEFIYIQDAQLEIGLVATEYIESGATTGKAGLLENEPRFNYPIGGSVPHLLLEPQRTNLLSNSEYLQGNSEFKVLSSSVTFADYTETSPEGNINALRILEAENTGNHNWYYDNLGTFVNGTTYTFSFFAKSIRGRNIRFDEGGVGMNMQGIIDLSDGSILQDAHSNVSVESYGNGWYRISAVGTMNGTTQRIIFNTTDGTTTSFAGDTTSGVSLWGVQIEEGSYPTSYIPNHSGGSISREVDIYQGSNIDAVTNMSTDECTVLLDVDLPQGRENSPMFLQFIDIAGGGSTYFGLKGVYVPSPIIQLFGTGTINQSNTHSLSVGRHKIAIRWLSGTATVYIDGAEVSALSTTDSAAPTSFDRVYGSGAGYRHFVHELIVFESGWDNVDLEILTGATPYKSFAAMAATLNYTVYE